jgi:hypothetical protein
VIGRQVLATLLPARRPRFSTRKVKCATSRYLRRDHNRPDASTPITTIQATICPPPATPPPPRPQSRTRPRTCPADRPAPTRRDRILAIMRTDPTRAWPGRDLATTLDIPVRNLLTQLAEWSRLGFLSHVSTGCYALPPSS